MEFFMLKEWAHTVSAQSTLELQEMQARIRL